MKSVCMIASGMGSRNWQLQPWRYLTEIARGLADLGHDVQVLSDGEKTSQDGIFDGRVTLGWLPTVRNPVWRPNHLLIDAMRQAGSEVIIWHLGLTSFVYQALPERSQIPVIGLFSTPVYRPGDLARLGMKRLYRYFGYSRIHLAGSLIPPGLIQARAKNHRLHSCVVQTQTTRQGLIQAGFRSMPIQVISPGIDQRWLHCDACSSRAARSTWEFGPQDLVLLYSGSPAGPRGLPTLLEALVCVRERKLDLKLVVLNRHRPDQWGQENRAIHRFLQKNSLEGNVRIISGFLEPEEVVAHVAAADIVVSPFELLLSDAPLSVLEAQALGKPIVTTRIACLPELVAGGKGYLAEPGDPASLARAIEEAAAGLGVDRRKNHTGVQRTSQRTWQDVGAEWSHYLETL